MVCHQLCNNNNNNNNNNVFIFKEISCSASIHVVYLYSYQNRHVYSQSYTVHAHYTWTMSTCTFVLGSLALHVFLMHFDSQVLCCETSLLCSVCIHCPDFVQVIVQRVSSSIHLLNQCTEGFRVSTELMLPTQLTVLDVLANIEFDICCGMRFLL